MVVALGAVTVLLQRRQILANRALRQLAETMRASALTDPLTGLSNRRHLLEHLERVSGDASRTGQPYAVLMIDLDRFKVINDGLGHAAGDAVLRAVADCLRQAARPGDLYGRWGGDELMVVVPTADGNGPVRTAERVLALAAKSHPRVDGTDVAFSVSIGCARGNEVQFDEVIRRADLALYRAKASGGGVVVEAGPAGAEPPGTGWKVAVPEASTAAGATDAEPPTVGLAPDHGGAGAGEAAAGPVDAATEPSPSPESEDVSTSSSPSPPSDGAGRQPASVGWPPAPRDRPAP